ncbi:hypothetical protein [Streptomyces sp. NBC_00568]|uniref:hypothetical protein n=1 Tax=Streptomyces sp. NBC_00568 TaxID=2975779 RepID=UPI00225480DD|nr:hypothetical protein [Streptomyces sp. NBC_00568]MCX4993614.1 hypothetical protein [Streptomyces sp. NBC_00568]
MSLVLVAVSVNRRGQLTLGYALPNEFLRWTELNNMALGLLTVLLYYLLIEHVRAVSAPSHRERGRRLLGALFVTGAYLYAAGYGNHEVTNYLHGRFCASEPSRLCGVIAFNDESFSHGVFFMGFVLLSVALMLSQAAAPDQMPLAWVDKAIVTVNALFAAGAIVANLAFERIGLDLLVVTVVAVLAVFLLYRMPRQPILLYHTIAYSTGTAATLALKLA